MNPKELEFPKEAQAGEEKTAQHQREMEICLQEEILHNHSNWLDHLAGETEAKTMMGQWWMDHSWTA